MSRPIKVKLFVDPTARPRWTGGEQLPLFVHGGYGAVREHVTAWCHCGWTLVRSITETNPRAVA